MNPTETAKAIRRLILERSFKANTGHVGSCLSVANIIAALYAEDGGVLNFGDPQDSCPAAVHSICRMDGKPCACDLYDTPEYPDRDRFVLSCGHKALALYAAIHLRGWISKDDLDTFCQPGSPLYTHPNHEVRGVEYSTGSLGMGLSYACGEALAARMQGSKRLVYCLLSDGELNEGSVWEAVMFAAHHKLDNLVAIVDCNGQQALGKTADICDLQPLDGLVGKFKAFGWHAGIHVPECSGGDPFGFFKVGMLEGQPTCQIVPTTFGHGVSFMEDSLEWHYKPMSDQEYMAAAAEVSNHA